MSCCVFSCILPSWFAFLLHGHLLSSTTSGPFLCFPFVLTVLASTQSLTSCFLSCGGDGCRLLTWGWALYPQEVQFCWCFLRSATFMFPLSPVAFAALHPLAASAGALAMFVRCWVCRQNCHLSSRKQSELILMPVCLGCSFCQTYSRKEKLPSLILFYCKPWLFYSPTF